MSDKATPEMAFNKASAGFSITVRLKIVNIPGKFLRIAQEVAESNSSMNDVKLLYGDVNYLIRELTVNCVGETAAKSLVDKLSSIDGVELLDWRDDTFHVHLGGKLEMRSRIEIKNIDDLSRAYTPGVARVCTAIEEDPSKAYLYTTKCNTIAVITDGSAVLGLGDIGPLAAMPVMEGKSILFKQFANIDSFPIC